MISTEEKVENLAQSVESALQQLGIILHEETDEKLLQKYNTIYKNHTPTLQLLMNTPSSQMLLNALKPDKTHEPTMAEREHIARALDKSAEQYIQED